MFGRVSGHARAGEEALKAIREVVRDGLLRSTAPNVATPGMRLAGCGMRGW